MASLPKIQGFDDPDYDPFAADELNFGDHRDPYPLFAEWREKRPVFEGSFREQFGMTAAYYPNSRVFVVAGTSEIIEALTASGDRFSNAAYQFSMGATFGMGSIVTMDNPEHGRWRKIFQKIFLPQYVKKWGDTIVDPVVERLMNRFAGSGRADLVQDFTIRYPFDVIYRQLNLPEEDVDVFQRLALGQTDFARFDRAVEAGEKLGVYFKALVEERRTNPGDDLVTRLAMTEAEGDYLPELVLISFLRQLMNAGGDTTFRGTSILLTALLQHPDQLEAVRADRSLIPQAIEEALRWDGPLTLQTRMAAVDMEMRGVFIPAGSVLDLATGASNRDPELYADPDKFDIFRERKPHFAFSRGPHLCIGQHLARVEMTRALEAILDRLPNLRLDPDMPAPDIRGIMMRVPQHIHVRFDG